MATKISHVLDLIKDDVDNILGYQKEPGTMYALGVTMSNDMPVTGNRPLNEGDLEKCLNAVAAAVLTIPNDTAFKLSTNATYRACIAVYQETVGAVTFVPGSGVAPIEGTAKTAGPGVTHGIMRVGPNRWAYL